MDAAPCVVLRFQVLSWSDPSSKKSHLSIQISPYNMCTRPRFKQSEHKKFRMDYVSSTNGVKIQCRNIVVEVRGTVTGHKGGDICPCVTSP
jgi:hypothetical protein